MPKIKYDVMEPRMTEGNAKHLRPFVDFVDSDHQTMTLEYENTQKALAPYKAIYGYMCRNDMHEDIRIKRRQKRDIR